MIGRFTISARNTPDSNLQEQADGRIAVNAWLYLRFLEEGKAGEPGPVPPLH